MSSRFVWAPGDVTITEAADQELSASWEMATYYARRSGRAIGPCQLRVDGDEISVTYEEDDGSIAEYKGSDLGSGHYALTYTGYPECKATLHKRPNEDMLEGWWLEDGEEGMWQIYRVKASA